MRSKKPFPISIRLVFSLILATSLLPTLALAQDAGQTSGQTPGQDASKPKPASKDASQNPDDKDAAPASPVALAWADSYIRQIGSSGLLAGNRQGIGWGSLYIPSASVTGIYDRSDASGTLPSTDYTAAILQTTVIYDHMFGTSRVAVQYQPSMAISDGQVVSNFSNQNTNLDILLYTRPRWNVKFSDGFRYYYTQETVGLPYLDVNATASGLATNNFLDGSGRWLSNTATLSIAYALSRRASITITPTYTYSESGTGAAMDRGAAYGGTVSWNYRLSERQTVGLAYTGQLLQEAGLGISTVTPTISAVTDTMYNTIAATAGRQLTATLFTRGSLGVTTSASDLVARQWSFYGTFALVKQLGRSSFGLNYSRGDTLGNGLISSAYADRVDLTYQSHLGTRFNWSAGGGYLRQIESGGFSGWYGTGDAQFLLAPRAGIFATFDYYRKNQAANLDNLYVGNRDIYTFGLRWQPALVLH
jgi:hypothetical protein